MNIEDIDWANFEHAYGPATDVPRILANLASDDEADSNNGLYALYGSLFHQGTIYDATVAAVPFIVELALRPSTLQRTELLLYIGALIDELGEEPPDLDDLELPDFFDREELAARIAAQHEHVEAIGAIVARHAAEFRGLLDGELEEAIAAATILRNLGEAGAAEKLAELFALRPVRYALVYPNDSDAAAQVAAAIGRPELTDAVFLFFDGDTSALDEIIVEDADDFPPELMDDAREIANELYADLIAYVDEDLGNFRFYAGKSVEELDEICTGLDWERVEIELEDDVELDSDPGKTWDEITAAERALLQRFVDTLDEAGWQETRPWHENLQNCGWSVSPQGVGRYIAGDAVLEAGLWLYDPIASADVAGFVGEPHVRLVIHNGMDAAMPLRFYGDLDTILDVLVAHQRDLTPANYIEAFLDEMFDATTLLLAEAHGGLMKLEKG